MFLICPCVFCLSVVLDCCLVLRIQYMYHIVLNWYTVYIQLNVEPAMLKKHFDTLSALLPQRELNKFKDFL